ncbi:MAG: hypothetical protein LIO79_09765, partial [Rikenellaceae bacterium]|nr:hypothetical protein [Rikenellaceae bacterium]
MVKHHGKRKNHHEKRKNQFYQEHRESCAEQYNMAEAPDIDQLYENIEKKELNRILAHVSVVVLTANKYEKNILHSNWSKRTDHKKIYKTTLDVGNLYLYSIF